MRTCKRTSSLNDQAHTTLHCHRTKIKQELYSQSDLKKKEQQLQDQLETKESEHREHPVKERSPISEERHTTTLRSNQQEKQQLEQQQPKNNKQNQESSEQQSHLVVKRKILYLKIT